MTSSQSIDEFFALANALILKLRIAENYATRPHELTTVCTFEGGEEMAITQAQTRLVDRRKALAELEAEIRTSLNELRAAFIALKTEYGASLKEFDGYQPTGHTIAFEALQSATYDVCRWMGETLSWLPTSNKIQARLTPPLIRKCGEIADGFPFAHTQEAAIRKQLWHEQGVLMDRAEPLVNTHEKPGPEFSRRADAQEAYFKVWNYVSKPGNTGKSNVQIQTATDVNKTMVGRILNETRAPTTDELESTRTGRKKR
jgi:hypothetical protein